MRKYEATELALKMSEVITFANTHGSITDEQLLALVRGEDPKEVLGDIKIHIFYIHKTITFREFCELNKNNTFRYRRIDVSCQRDAVWKLNVSRRFIQTIFSKYSCPEIVLNERGGLLRVIDGNNRRRALYGFFNNLLRLPRGTEICGRNVSNMTYGEIMVSGYEDVKRYINELSIPVVIYKELSDAEEMEVFCHRNKGENPNNAEKRNGIYGEVRDAVIRISRKYSKMYSTNGIIVFDSDLEQDSEEAFSARRRYGQKDNEITTHVFMQAMKFNSGMSFNGKEFDHNKSLTPLYELDSFKHGKEIHDAESVCDEYMFYVKESYKHLKEWERQTGYKEFKLNIANVTNLVFFLHKLTDGNIKHLSIKNKKQFYHSYFDALYALHDDKTPNIVYGDRLVPFRKYMDKNNQKAIDLRIHMIFEKFFPIIEDDVYLVKKSRSSASFRRAEKAVRKRANGNCEHCSVMIDEGEGEIHHLDYNCNGSDHDPERMIYVHKHCHRDEIHNEFASKPTTEDDV